MKNPNPQGTSQSLYRIGPQFNSDPDGTLTPLEQDSIDRAAVRHEQLKQTTKVNLGLADDEDDKDSEGD